MDYKYSFVKSEEQVALMKKTDSFYKSPKTLMICWEVDADLFRKVLPPDLEMDEPIVTAGFIDYAEAGFGFPPYVLGVLGLNCSYKGVKGSYCLAMAIEGSDMGIYYGREMYGYPKKHAHVTFDINGNKIYGKAERNGITFFEVNAEIGKYVGPDSEKYFPTGEVVSSAVGNDFHLDYKVEAFGGDHTPTEMWKFTNVKLVHTVCNSFNINDVPCSAEVILRPSEDDPWIQLAPKKILGAVYRQFDVRLMGNELDKAYTQEEGEALAPYLFTRYDAPIFRGF